VETTRRNGGGAIMAIGRAKGDHRVERAIIDALDSPLLHGNDISRAKRILFNIYASEENPILIPEMQEVDDFFDQLNPDVEVIWGTSTDDSLGEDAKVIILATDMNDEEELVSKPRLNTDDEYYERLIKELYKPLKAKVEPSVEPLKEEPQEEPPFVVEPVAEPEPAQEPVVEEEEGSKSVVSRMKSWLNRQLNLLAQDEI
jgi:cell division protein FtsZ